MSASATRGAVFLRVPRDDAYIQEMLARADRFYELYGDPDDPRDPPPCFGSAEAGWDAFVSGDTQ